MASKKLSPAQRLMRALIDISLFATNLDDDVILGEDRTPVEIEAVDAVIWVARAVFDLDWRVIEEALPRMSYERIFFCYCRAIGVLENQHKEFAALVNHLHRAGRRAAKA